MPTKNFKGKFVRDNYYAGKLFQFYIKNDFDNIIVFLNQFGSENNFLLQIFTNEI